MNQVATIAPSRLPIPASVAKEFDIQPAQWRVLVEQIFPSAKTVEAVTMALSYCRARNLDIYKKPVHVVPMWSSTQNKMVESVWPGIAEIRTTASRTGEYAGIDEVKFGPMIERTFHGERDVWEERRKVGVEKFSKTVRYPEWASVVVYRWVKGQKAAFHTKIYWEETYATVGKTEVPNDMWTKRPRGQIDKCVEAAALRKAFPEEVGSMYAAEEMEGRVIDHDAGEKTTLVPPKPPAPPSTKQDPETDETRATDVQRAQGQVIDAEVMNEDAGEIIDEDAPDDGEQQDSDGPADFFERLEEALLGAATEEDLEVAWNDFDVQATFDGDDINQGIAMAIKRRAIKTLKERGDGKK